MQLHETAVAWATAASPEAIRPLSELQLCCVALTMKMLGSESCQVLFHRETDLGMQDWSLWCQEASRALLLCQRAHHKPKATLKLGGKYQGYPKSVNTHISKV